MALRIITPKLSMEITMSLHIRPENPADFPAIHELVRLAFEKAEHSDGDEHHLVDRLRATPDYIPGLALVAEAREENAPASLGGSSGERTGGRIGGHIMFTRLKVGEATALALAPVSVLPSYQGKGVGSALIRRGHELARAMGWEFVVLVGHAGYYPRFGYKPAASFGMTLPFEVPAECFMAINLQGGPQHLPGVVRYSQAFFPHTAE